jgi:hypothetical protein
MQQRPGRPPVRRHANLTLRWERVTPVLDRLAEQQLTWRNTGRRSEHMAGTLTLTIDDLRAHVDS